MLSHFGSVPSTCSLLIDMLLSSSFTLQVNRLLKFIAILLEHPNAKVPFLILELTCYFSHQSQCLSDSGYSTTATIAERRWISDAYSSA